MVRFYNEGVYLSGKKEAIDEIEKQKTKFIISSTFNSVYFKDEIQEYIKFLELVKKFLSTFNADNQIQYSLLISYLLRSGIFSIGKNFKYTSNLKNELEGHLGLTILSGKGCCRNVSSFYEDLMGDKADSFYCRLERSKLNLGQFKEARHVVNIIDFNGNLYAYDPINIGLFYFINKEQLKLLSDSNIMYLRFKPYFGVITNKYEFGDIEDKYKLYEEASKKLHITTFDYELLRSDTLNRLNQRKMDLLDFKDDTMVLKETIHYSVQEKVRKLHQKK